MSDKAEGKGETSNSHQVKAEKSDGPPSPKRIKIADNVNDLKKSSREFLLSRFQEQDKYIDYLEEKIQKTSSAGELTSLRESEEKLKLQQQESTRRENVLVMRLATKEQEMQELLTQIHDLKQAQNPAGAQLRATLLDPAVNIVFQRMKSELDETKEKLEQAQNDLSAWKFTPDSVTGKKLMAKCRMLIQENTELGGRLSKGRVAQLEAELALQKKYSEELTTSEDELREFVIQLDEEVEGMQSTILTLQQQLKGVKNELIEEKKMGEKQVEQIRILERNLDHARTQPPSPEEGGKQTIEDMRCDTDRTEADSLGSGPENMETERSNEEPQEDNRKPEAKDLQIPIQSANTDEQNVKYEPAGSVPPGYRNVSSVTENVQHEDKNVITEVDNVFPKVRDVSPGFENKEFETNNAKHVVENMTYGNESVRYENENVHLGTDNLTSVTENPKSNSENTKSITEDVPSRTVEKVSPFGSPNVRKSAGTPPCPTTFSISQILGEPKRTPSPISDDTGGDAVVTKIPYIGGYSDSTVEDHTLRTEGSGLQNGEAKDGTQPVVT